MKFTKYIMLLAAAAGISAACQKLEMVQMADPSQVVAPVLDPVDQIIVTEESMAQAVDFKWSAADYGVATEIRYAVEMGIGDGPKIELKSASKVLELSLTHETINERMLYGLELAPNVETEINFYISSRIGNTEKVFSAPVPVKVKPIFAERVYPMVYVIGAYNNWKDPTMQRLFDFAEKDAEYSGIIGFGGKAVDGFKIKGTATGWDDKCNWGLDGDADAPEKEAGKVSLISKGSSANINVYSKSFYIFTFTKAPLELNVISSFNSVGVIGSAAGAEGEDKDMKFSTTKQLFWLDAELVDGTLKFRADDADELVWGIKETGDKAVKRGVLTGKADIKVPAGKYRIWLDLRNPAEPSFRLSAGEFGLADPDPEPDPEPEPEPEPEKKEAWSVIGSITEWEKNELILTNINGLWRADGLDFPEGAEFLIRWKQGWDKKYGVAAKGDVVKVGEETTLTLGGENIKLDKAGKFDLVFNPETGTIKLSEEGTEPKPVLSEWGIVGTVNKWTAPDIPLVQEGDYFVKKGLELSDTDMVKFRKNGKWPNEGGDEATSKVVAPNADITLGKGPENMSFPAGTYDVYINADCTMCWFMTEGKTPADSEGPAKPKPAAHTWSLVGIPDFETDVAMVEKEGIWTAYGVEITAEQSFKVRADELWKLSYGAEGETEPVEVALETAVKVVTGGKNMKVAVAGKYDIAFDPANETITLKTASTEPVVSAWGIVGTVNEWKAPDLELVKEGNYFVHKGLVLGEKDSFKFRKDGKWPNEGGADASNPAARPNEETVLSPGGGNISLPAGTYDIYTDANCTKCWLMTAGKTPADATAPEPVKHTWSLVGIPNFETDIAMTEAEGVWTATAVRIKKDQTFKVRADNGWALSYGATGDVNPTVISLDQAVKLTSANGKDMCVAAAEGLYDITFNPAEETILIKTTPIN